MSAPACTCHRERGDHDLCCGRPGGIDPDCPLHGDGSDVSAWEAEADRRGPSAEQDARDDQRFAQRPVTPAEYGFGDEDAIFGHGP